MVSGENNVSKHNMKYILCHFNFSRFVKFKAFTIQGLKKRSSIPNHLGRWAVDLDEPHLIHEVVVWTMDSSTNWIRNFLVKVTDIEPPVPSVYDLDHRGYRLCGQYPGTPPTAASAVIECRGNDTIGQYVYIHITGE